MEEIEIEPMDPLTGNLLALVRTGRRPKGKLTKREAQIVESHVPSLVGEAHLQCTLVTVLVDPTRPITPSWRAAIADLETVRGLLDALPGLSFAMLALEIHGGSRPKKRQAPQPQAQREGEDPQVHEEGGEDLEPEPEGPAQALPASHPLGMRGKPHMHLLVYYPSVTNPPLDLSHVKRKLQAIFPRSDVNQVQVRMKGKDGRASIVKTMNYVLKGSGCPFLREIWTLVFGEEAAPPLPTMILSRTLAHGSTLGIRLIHLATAMGTTFSHPFGLAVAEAPAEFSAPPGSSRETECMYMFASYVHQRGYALRGKDWYIRSPNTTHTWERAFDYLGLLRIVSSDKIMCDIIVRYATSIPTWFRLASFKTLPDRCYTHIELQDCVYTVRGGAYIDKNDFIGTCFRYYPITRRQSLDTSPTEWLRLIDWQYRLDPLPKTERSAFLNAMTGLLRLRAPKERILFIVGNRNTGKSTVIKWITELYPPDAVGFINDSIASLSGVKDKEILVADEFTTAKISRSNLLLLTDGTNGLVVRNMGQNAEFITNVLMPQVYCGNFEPAYKNDDSGAVEIRFNYFHWRESIPIPDPDKAQKIKEETPFILFYLNRRAQDIE